jgi:hypothetical protein
MLANANAGEGRRRARQVAAVLVDVRGLQQAFERGREIGEIEMAARERMPGLSDELPVAAARDELPVAAARDELSGFLRNQEGPLRIAVPREFGRQRVERARATGSGATLTACSSDWSGSTHIF